MKTIHTDLFSFAELSDEAKAVALAGLRRNAEQDGNALGGIYGEMQDSLKAVADACGFRVTDYAYGPCCQGWKVSIAGTEEETSGPRALAVMLRALMEKGYERPAKFADMKFPGVCGFTGVCYDDDVAETVWKSLLEGETFAKAFNQVAYKFCQSAEAELEYLMSDEWLTETAEDMGEVFTADGSQF